MKLRHGPYDGQALTRMTRRAARLLQRGTMVAAMGGSFGCDANDPGVEAASPVPIEGTAAKADWAQYEGRRNVDLVSYLGSYWHEYSNCNTRGGCMNVSVFVKVRVKPVAGAVIEKKRVGLVYRGDNGTETTVTGRYYSTLADGSEEWHVPVYRNAWSAGYFTFNAWYQDGAGGTWFDDNEGELHALVYQGNYSVVRQDWSTTDLTVDERGVTGHIGVFIADLDYDKDIEIVYTTDGWQTVQKFAMGSGEKPNTSHWIEDVWYGMERWGVDVEIAAEGVERFEYAIRYRHGVVANARSYDFWDNNGGNNYVVKRAE